jgi:four helix bundle protein
MKNAFNHEDLTVYQRALSFFGVIEPIAFRWESKHAIKNHLLRAAESVVENIAASSASYTAMKQAALDYALGSVLECAACIDVAVAKKLISQPVNIQHKEGLAEIFRMLVGLRRSWSRNLLNEDPPLYGTQANTNRDDPLFHHERLDVYRVSMTLMGSFFSLEGIETIPIRLFRKLDGLATSIVLNIAEGNGRFSELDHRRFLEIAHRSAIKMAAQLDLCGIRKVLTNECIYEWKRYLSRIAAMTAAMIERN